MNEDSFIVRSLTCKRDLDMAIIAYTSFLKLNGQKIKLIVHTDGSLSKADIDTLCTAVPNIQVIDRKASEEQVKEVLGKYPKCLEFRDNHPLSNKLLDIPILEPSCIRFIDCDILFIRPFTALFSDDKSSRFCLENDSGYSGRLVDVMQASPNEIPRCCNTGILQLDKINFDLDYVEWFLSQKNLCTILPMAEQTLFAIFMGATKADHFSTKQISSSKDKITIGRETVAIHFLYNLKSHFFDIAKKYRDAEADEKVDLRLCKSKKLTYSYVLERKIRRELVNLFS